MYLILSFICRVCLWHLNIDFYHLFWEGSFYYPSFYLLSIFGFSYFIFLCFYMPMQMTCQLLGVILEEKSPEELQVYSWLYLNLFFLKNLVWVNWIYTLFLQKHATVRPSVVEILLEITKYCDLYLMETVLDDESEVCIHWTSYLQTSIPLINECFGSLKMALISVTEWFCIRFKSTLVALYPCLLSHHYILLKLCRRHLASFLLI